MLPERAATVIVPIGRGMQFCDPTSKTIRVWRETRAAPKSVLTRP